MLTLNDKATAVALLSAMADSLLTAVRTHSDHAPDPFCDAVELFLRHLDDTGCLDTAGLALLGAVRHLQSLPPSGMGRSPSVSLVYLLGLAMGTPAIAQHMVTLSHRGKGH